MNIKWSDLITYSPGWRALTVVFIVFSAVGGVCLFVPETIRNPAFPVFLIALAVVTCFAGYFADRLHQYSTRMNESLTLYSMLSRSVSDIVLICKQRPGGNLGCFLDVNDTASDVLGYSRQDLLTMTLKDLSAGSDDPDRWTGCLDSGEAFDQTRKCKDGALLKVETRAWRLRYHGTQVIMFIDRVKPETSGDKSEMERIRKEADTANRAKSAFLANMSHEIRTPMNAILGYTQLLRRDKSLGLEAREHLDIIHRSGEHLLALINDVLELSKIEAGRAVLNTEPFDMDRLMTDIQRMFQLRIKQKGLCFSVESQSLFGGSILADQGKVRQIMINMLGNAVKFTEKGGIIVRYGCDQLSSTGKLKVWVEVEDTGRGIAEADLGKVFKPFEQAGTSSDEGGTGLGMTISREYARVMGGDISVRSVIRKGTTFRLEFEAVPSDDSLSDDLQNTTILKLILNREYTILVADDREHNRRLLETLLGNNGFIVKTAADGLEAVEMFKNETPDLIIMDLKMSTMDGAEATRTIRALPRGNQVPIILVTASISDMTVPESGEDLFSTVIRKPFKDTELLAAIRDALRLDYKYEYEPKVPVDIFTTTQMKVSSRIIASDTRAAMGRAIRNGDMDRFSDLLDNLALEHPLMAARLKHYADDFDFDKLLLILEDPEKML